MDDPTFDIRPAEPLAERASAAGSLVMEPTQMPAPIGYICTMRDPDETR